MKQLTYDQTMAVLEDFMQKSGIAKFCREYCKGKCCGSCWKGSNACHRNEGRRLACTAFICPELFLKLGYEYESDDRRIFRSAKLSIENRICEYRHTRNVYFTPTSLEEMKEFRIPESVITGFFNDENAVEIKQKINAFL